LHFSFAAESPMFTGFFLPFCARPPIADEKTIKKNPGSGPFCHDRGRG
jgi:hypothetical protein